MSTTRWWNRDYVVDIEVHVFLDKDLWSKHWIKSKIIICVSHCSLWNINEYRFRLGLTNLYSIDEYKNQSLLFYLKYFVLYELMHNPTPSFAEEQILFSPLK